MTPDPARDQRLRRAFLAPSRARVAGLALRPFSLWTLDFCDELGLAFFTSAKETSAPVELSGPEQLSALVWGHLAEIDPGKPAEFYGNMGWQAVMAAREKLVFKK